jgi:hypothetical protein
MEQYWTDTATKNCVWLFQTRQKVVTNRSDLDYMSRSDIIEGMLNHTKSISEIKRAVREYQEEGIYPPFLVEYAEDTWYTEAVYLFREEARNHGKRRPYAWGKEDEGWRIYGVPILGEAVTLLQQSGVNQDLIDTKLEALKWDNL